MAGLNSVIQRINLAAPHLASGLSDTARKALESYRVRVIWISGALLFVVFASVVLVFVASALHIEKPGELPVVKTGLGLSLGASLVLLYKTWKDWSYVNLLLILMEGASDSQIRDLFKKLARKI